MAICLSKKRANSGPGDDFPESCWNSGRLTGAANIGIQIPWEKQVTIILTLGSQCEKGVTFYFCRMGQSPGLRRTTA